MITIPYHFYGNDDAAGAVQTVQAIADGPIVAIQLNGMVQSGAAADVDASWEIAFTTPGTGYGTDSRGVLMKLLLNFTFGDATSHSSSSRQTALSGLMIPWALGERLYLNLGYIAGTGTFVYGAAIVHQAVDDKNFARMQGRFV